MARFGAAWGVMVAALASAISGCGGPPPPPARIAKTSVVRAGAKSVEVVPAPRIDPALVEAVTLGSRVQAGFEKLRVEVADVASGGQAEAVRLAVARRPQAIVVEAPAASDAELEQAVAEAKAAGLLIVVLGRPLATEAPGPGRVLLVASSAFDPSAGRLVELAMRNAGNGGLDPRSGALVVVRPDADPLVADRAGALKKALQDARVAVVQEVVVGGDAAAAAAAVAEAVRSSPGVTLVLAADGPAMTAADQAMGIVKNAHPYIVAGYTDSESYARSQVIGGEYAAIGGYAQERLFRKGIQIVARVLRGEETAERTEVDVPLMESPRTAGLSGSRFRSADPRRTFSAE